MPFRLLSERDVRSLASTEDLVPAMAEALTAFSTGAMSQPSRTALWVGEERAFYGLMPAYLPARGALGTKLITYFTANPARGLPAHYATIVLLDSKTGALVAVMDGAYITQIRTAAVSLLAVRHLATRPVQRLAVFGCGVQARGHVLALGRLLPSLEEVRVWSPHEELPGFVDEMSAGVRPVVRAAADGEDAVRGADLVVTVTSSPVPVVEREWVEQGALVISVGACRPDHREIDPALLASGRLFVDSREAALAESGDVIQGISEGRFGPDHIEAELGEVIAGRPIAGNGGDPVIFKSLGLAVEDVAAADVVYRRAVDCGVGAQLSL
ncbi:MAG: ornithine cyclodeaminase family protein [Acidobacteria bacterium]|nr:ornithine cyclodeaminase family protein [Acidobacteriota bacterium]